MTGLILSKIKNIEFIEEEDRYDLEVEDNNNFFANNILVHNCRALITKDGMFSRTGEVFKSCDHVYNLLVDRDFFKLYPNAVLDGELYNEDIGFNNVMSIVRRDYNTDKELNIKYGRRQPKDNKLVDKLDSKLIKYYVYDHISNDVYTDRFSQLFNWNKAGLFDSTCIELVNSIRVLSDNLTIIDGHYKECLGKGYEGQMIRFNQPYINKRTKYLLKRKEWIDSEYTLLDILEGNGNWTNRARIAVFDGFNADIVGTYDECANWLKNKDSYIGKDTTVKYFELTEDGVPRFGKVKELDRQYI